MAESLIVLETISSRVNQVHVFISFFQNSYENCEPNFWRVWISFSELKRKKGWRELIWGCPIHSFPFFFFVIDDLSIRGHLFLILENLIVENLIALENERFYFIFSGFLWESHRILEEFGYHFQGWKEEKDDED